MKAEHKPAKTIVDAFCDAKLKKVNCKSEKVKTYAEALTKSATQPMSSTRSSA